MKVLSLVSKLNKMKVPFVVVDVNEYNKDIVFQINSMNFKAGYVEGSEEVEDFCREICWDNVDQEMQRRFFDNFNQLVKYANS
jgi:hypothetical protein